jgi:hypothetical protein
MENEENNWNELNYAKYTFCEHSIWLDNNKKEVAIYVYLEIDYYDSVKPKITINTQIVVKNHGELRYSQLEEISLKNLFKLENISDLELYLLPLEDKVIKKALKHAEKKIEQYIKVEGQNL